MSGVSDLKARALALEAKGKLPEALQAFRDCVLRLEGTPAFLRELPLLVRVGDLELRLGNRDAATVAYERALGFYVKHGRADSVIATGLRLARIQPGKGSFLDLALQLVGARHPEPARRVLLEAARRSGHEAEAEELEALEGAPPAQIGQAVERLVRAATAPGAPARRPMSLQDAIAEMRRRSGLTERPSHGEPELPPAPEVPPPRRRSRVLVSFLIIMAFAVGGAGVAVVANRTRPEFLSVLFEGSPLSFPRAAVAAEPAAASAAPPEPSPEPSPEPGPAVRAAAPAAQPAPVTSPPPARSPTPSRPAPRGAGSGVGMLTVDSSARALAARPAPPPAPPATAPSSVPAWLGLPPGTELPAPVVVVRDLPIGRLESAGRGFRLSQMLPSGQFVTITLAPFPGSGVSSPRVTPQGADSAVGSMRFGGYMVNARAPVAPDSLHTLLLRLVEVGPSR